MYHAVVIGGSAGSFQEVIKILGALSPTFPLPVFLCLHRLKNVRSGFVETMALKSGIPVIEPYSKDSFEGGKAYLAPANYHMYIGQDHCIHLSVEEPHQHSRPSIDLTFFSAIETFGKEFIAILLSGANRDGAAGIRKAAEKGALTIVQDPATAEVPVMVQAALQTTKVSHVMTVPQIIDFLLSLQEPKISAV